MDIIQIIALIVAGIAIFGYMNNDKTKNKKEVDQSSSIMGIVAICAIAYFLITTYINSQNSNSSSSASTSSKSNNSSSSGSGSSITNTSTSGTTTNSTSSTTTNSTGGTTTNSTGRTTPNSTGGTTTSTTGGSTPNSTGGSTTRTTTSTPEVKTGIQPFSDIPSDANEYDTYKYGRENFTEIVPCKSPITTNNKIYAFTRENFSIIIYDNVVYKPESSFSNYEPLKLLYDNSNIDETIDPYKTIDKYRNRIENLLEGIRIYINDIRYKIYKSLEKSNDLSIKTIFPRNNFKTITYEVNDNICDNLVNGFKNKIDSNTSSILSNKDSFINFYENFDYDQNGEGSSNTINDKFMDLIFNITRIYLDSMYKSKSLVYYFPNLNFVYPNYSIMDAVKNIYSIFCLNNNLNRNKFYVKKYDFTEFTTKEFIDKYNADLKKYEDKMKLLGGLDYISINSDFKELTLNDYSVTNILCGILHKILLGFGNQTNELDFHDFFSKFFEVIKIIESNISTYYKQDVTYTNPYKRNVNNSFSYGNDGDPSGNDYYYVKDTKNTGNYLKPYIALQNFYMAITYSAYKNKNFTTDPKRNAIKTAIDNYFNDTLKILILESTTTNLINLLK